MHARILALSALAMLSANVANATTYFDSINIPAGSLNAGSDGPSESSTLIAQSFNVPGTPDFNSVTLALSADVPSDGGSTMIYLVPDDGSGGTNIAGNPLLTLRPSFSTAIGFDPSSQLLGTVSDSSLAMLGDTPTLVTLSISSAAVAAVTATTSNGEYWIALVPDNLSSVEWMQTLDGSGVGIANQEYFDNSSSTLGGTYGITPGTLDNGGSPSLEMTVSSVDTPEPATLAILGGGLAGLGYIRRRKAAKQA